MFEKMLDLAKELERKTDMREQLPGMKKH